MVDLRAFFEDLAVWGSDRRPANSSSPATSHASTVPCPKPFRPTSTGISWPPWLASQILARHGLAILRGTGMRLGELLDLELDCLWDFGDRGTWVKVPLGKLGTERTVPLDEPTVADFDAWIAQHGPQRALIHPRHGQPATSCSSKRVGGYRRSGFATAWIRPSPSLG